jgi:cysteinyl-tRNA synthetase
MNRKALSFLLLLLAGLAADCLAQGQSLNQAGSWAYQLQNADPTQLAACKYDVIVMDYSRDGTDSGAYTAAEIKAIRDRGKIVLCYLSIGEAENYRFYWKTWWTPGINCQLGNPLYLGPANPDWPGNYKVRYWYAGWWTDALQPYLDRILNAGFDGVYLDIIDAYWFWFEQCNISLTTNADKMVALVEKIGSYTRASHPGFILCPQNGESIIDDVSSAAVKNRYFAAINAIGVEDLFYNNTDTPQDHAYRLQMLGLFRQAGKKVFNIEYVGRTVWSQYLGRVCATNLGIIPYANPDRDLKELVPDFPQVNCVNPGVLLMLLD